MKPNNVYLTWAKRTAMGKIGGALASMRIDDMMATVLSDLKGSLHFDPLEIDDVIVGCANQAGEDNRNLARMSLLLAGFPIEVPGSTVNRLCASGLDAVLYASARIASGMSDCIVAGGAESMSRAPYVLSKPESAYDRNQKMWDSSFGWRFPNDRMKALFPLLGMGETAEEIYKEVAISREDQDKFALSSHQKSSKAYADGLFQKEILPLSVQAGKATITVDRDECIREDTTLEKLAKLKPVFRQGGTVTAGNSSPMNDGASAVLLVSEDFLKRHKLTPILRIVHGQVAGVHPNVMGLGPVAATQKLLKKQNRTIQDFDVFELNEAFAIQALSCMKKLDIDPSKVNLRGGAISLGHPLGCSGTRILTTLSSIMKDNPKLKRGLLSMCIGVGQGIALEVENC